MEGLSQSTVFSNLLSRLRPTSTYAHHFQAIVARRRVQRQLILVIIIVKRIRASIQRCLSNNLKVTEAASFVNTTVPRLFSIPSNTGRNNDDQ